MAAIDGHLAPTSLLLAHLQLGLFKATFCRGIGRKMTEDAIVDPNGFRVLTIAG